jgi:hypothetical protein
VSDELNIAATSGSSTTATTPSDISPAKRFGLARLQLNRYSFRIVPRGVLGFLGADVFFIIFTLKLCCFAAADNPNASSANCETDQKQALLY